MNIDYSTYFPWGGKAEFDKKIISGKKLHTIRSYNRGVKSGAVISHGQKTGLGRFIREQFFISISTGFQGIQIKFKNREVISVKVGGKKVSLSEIAKNDGMTIDEFQMWFYQYQINNTFNGYVIHWTDLKY